MWGSILRKAAYCAVLFAGSVQGQVVTRVCDGAGSTCGGNSEIRARGFEYAMPYDSVNRGFIYFGANQSNGSIYSDSLFLYEPAKRTFTTLLSNGASDNGHCGQNGAPYDTAEPLFGHPEGSMWSDGTFAYFTSQLCNTQRPGFTNRLRLAAKTMAPRLSVAPFGTGDGTHNATMIAFQRMEYAPSVGKAFYLGYSGGGATPKAIEFRASTGTYHDITSSLTGDTLPGPYTGYGLVYLGGYLYLFGGCEGTLPGNNGDCNGTPLNGLIRFNPSTYEVTNLSPTGTAPGTAYTSYPLVAADTRRSRILVVGHNGTASALFAYSVAGNAWSEMATSGDALPVLPTNQGGSGNMAGYDPASDRMVTLISRGGLSTPEIHEISLSTGGPLSIALTIQEALYPGGSTGIARTDEPFTVGIPIPEYVGLTSTSTLGLTGAVAGQFRSLATWPSGAIKWLHVTGVLASLNAGATATVTLTNDGSGDFGGADLITDNEDGTFTISTNGGTCGAGSAICFDIKGAHFNVLNRVRIGSTEVLATSTAETRGLVLTGPDPVATYPDDVTCTAEGGSDCTHVYSSANDADSLCSIEQNGSVMGVLKCTGQHEDSTNNPYMKFTARLSFHQGKAGVKVQVILRNADYGTSGTFATAYKGFDGYELRLDPAITGTLSWTIANETATPASGTMSGTDTTYIYQGASDHMKSSDWCGFGCVAYTGDSGWRLNVNSSDTDTGAASQVLGGWANIEDSSGVGVSIGHYQMSAYWTKSVEFLAGGPDVRLGIWSARNTSNHYQAWPQHSVHDLLLNFHATTLSAASARDDFLRFQHYLVGRASVAHYNSSGALPHSIPTSAEEDAFYLTTATGASPPITPQTFEDFGISSSTWPLSIYRWYAQSAGSGANQSELRWSDMIQFIKRGWTGRYLNSAHFYRSQVESQYPRSDGFQWQDHPGEYDGFTQPSATSANSALAHRNWHDLEHHHRWGWMDYYFMTGDEAIKDAILDGYTDYFTNGAAATYVSGLPGGKTGTVDTSGTAVTYASGNQFVADMVGSNIKIGPAIYRIATYNSATSLTLATSAGSQTGATYYQGGGTFNTRSAGAHLTNAATLSLFLDSVGETSNATAVRTQSDQLYRMQVQGDGCMNSYPSNCSLGPLDGGPWPTGGGVNRKRGAHWGPAGTSGTWCGASHAYRVNSAFQSSILVEGLLSYAASRGSGWTYYNEARDLAYGLSQFALGQGAVAGELFVDDGGGGWENNGFRFGIAFDRENNCSGGGESAEENFAVPSFGQQTVWKLFSAKQLYDGGTSTWLTKAKIAAQKLINGGATFSDFGSYQIGNLISASLAGSTVRTVVVPTVQDNMDGTYDLEWTPPASVSGAYTIKYSPLDIVDWIGFDPGDNVFIGDPATTENWFAAARADEVPSCTATCTVTINTGLTGLTSDNVSVSVMAAQAAGVSSRMSGTSRLSGGSRR